MKFIFTEPKKTTAPVTFMDVDGTRLVETTNGNLIKVGIGEKKKFSDRKFHVALRKAIRMARECKISSILIDANAVPFSLVEHSDQEKGRLFAENALMANYEFTRYKSTPEAYKGLESIYITNASTSFKKGVAIGEVIGEALNTARDLANTPGGDMTPTVLAKGAQQFAKNTPIKVTVLEKKDAQKLGMGLILGVDQGSVEPMKFIVMEYWGAGKSAKQKPIVLIGKGITFDSGGINLKPTDGLLGMNQDMSGGAAVMATISALAKLKVKKNIIALVPAVENAVSGSAYRPGDVLTSMSGKTVEVLNTDAEGRLVLGDALTYAEQYKPRLVIDVATLTGAALVTIGKRACIIMTPSQKLENKTRELGELSGDYVWPLPLWEEYRTDINSAVADMANVSGSGPFAKSGAGSIQGGIFLKDFAESFPEWMHIDMVPRMESIPDDNLARGSVGAPVRLLIRLVESS